MKRADLGVRIGGLIAVLVVIGSFAAILTGHESAGVAAIVATLGSLAGLFIYGDVKKRAERGKKSGR